VIFMVTLQPVADSPAGTFVAAAHWSAALVELDAVATVSTGGHALILAAEADAEADDADAEAEEAEADAEAEDWRA
jgi:hypothetical protein